MSKLSVAVCDENQSYGERVSAWLFVEQGTEFSGGFFSSTEAFKEQYDRQRFQVILLGRVFLLERWIQEEIKKRNDILWIYLQEEGEERLEILTEQLPAMEKYQPVSVIVRSIYRYYEEYHKEDIRTLGTVTEILGWFSPEQSIWQTPLAMSMASILAEREKVLYVNLKECSGLEQWFREEYEQDLLDVMYFCQGAEQRKNVELGRFVYSIGNLDYLPPVRDGVLLCELEEEDYSGLIEMLEKKTAYDIVVLDMGSMFPGFFNVWKRCGRIYIPQEQNVLAKGIDRGFQDMLRRQNDALLEDKISWLPMPDWDKGVLTSGCLMQQWLWGGQGDYVRELLGKRSRRD